MIEDDKWIVEVTVEGTPLDVGVLYSTWFCMCLHTRRGEYKGASLPCSLLLLSSKQVQAISDHDLPSSLY